MAVKTFTTGEVLTAADTNTYLANGGLVYVTSQTIGSTVSSVTVSNCFSSTYDNYRITVTGGAASTNISITIAFSGITTGYYGGLVAAKYDTGAVSGLGVNNAASWTYAGFGDANTLTLTADLLNVSTTERKHIAAGYTVIATGAYYGSFAGELTNTTAATSLVVAASTGTMTGGTITVYGYRKA